MITREATIEDWNKLYVFFKRIYRDNHPLQNKEFWIWQYGDKNFGRSFICVNEKQEIVGHVGANFGGNIAWIINVYLDEECRGKGILGKLYSLAREYYPLAATAANQAGLGLYQKMRWYRYHDLIRYVKINPKIEKPLVENVCQNLNIDISKWKNNDTHYFQQPTLNGLLFENNSAICNQNVGGLRVVDINDVDQIEDFAWSLGYNWIDYITSWNDLKLNQLEKNSWVLDSKSVVPWRLNPIQKDYFCDITFLSEKPLDNEFIVNRSYSDHGRIGSLIL
ncbi:GNAT family N-acetyltransferase [Flavobacterium capsici]|uniref:GNAT family N-acetyltransferase n=1 Tax=Flavobacterium capsici TaxID=3075618 RepID=A0AA96F2N6_9FLAO|nr:MULTISPECIES: GNAT family N-acetyltransferase [unclassified Flavobacterium]WNM20261.1 GNAT family N-acetyltransferase [Flavobacterium sp. PMR2A8]WNM21651.1 GNAT family N-acetyltransferase [Flavobacterium sp. PMTSA4]